MHRNTIARFSKLTGIDKSQLDPFLVSLIYGNERNLATVYKALKRDQLIQNTAKAAGISLADVLSLINAQKQP